MAWPTVGSTFPGDAMESFESVSVVPSFEGGVQIFATGVLPRLLKFSRLGAAAELTSFGSVAEEEMRLWSV